MVRRMRPYGLMIVLALAVNVSQGAVQPNPLFSDGMVLQRGKALPVWGTAEPGEQVTVTFLGQFAAATADLDGRWMVHLSPVAAGGPHRMRIAGTNTIEVQNVLVGEVWICSGQSNMAFGLASSFESEADMAAAGDPLLRLCTVPRAAAIEPQETAKLSWVESTSDTAKNFSAVGYYFGRKLRAELGVPVGLINTSYGGTPARAWTSYGTLWANPELRELTEQFEQDLLLYPERMKVYREETLVKWQEAVEKAKAEGKPAPRRPEEPMGPTHRNRPAGLYNAMIAPLIPYAIQGAIWYQGESDAGRPEMYQTLFPTMIQDWRAKWGQGDSPFLFVQLAPFMKIEEQPSDPNWARLREAQLMTLRNYPNTGMAVITDVGEEDDIHPRRKKPVGERLALSAMKLAYNIPVYDLGPLFEGYRIEGDTIRVLFSHVDGGLIARDGPLVGFTIAGKDRQFHHAEARIDGRDVVVRSPRVQRPVAVRFGWANYPVVNLWNAAGLPASPFRSDTWPRQ